jgi:hypothetical protein
MAMLRHYSFMEVSMSKGRIVGLMLGLVAILAAFGIVLWQGATVPVVSTALAQGAATATPAAGATPAPQQQQAPIGDSFWTLLASKLGLTLSDLTAKAVEARKEMIDAAVTNGRITQAQADAIKQRIDANGLIAPIQLPRGQNQLPRANGQNGRPGRGVLPGFGNHGGIPGVGKGFPGGIFGRGGISGGLDALEAIASAVKLEPKALIEQLSGGKTLAEIAQAQGVDQATVKQAIITFRTAQIDQQLALGLISEVQANQLKAQLTPENIDLSRGFRFH